VLLFYTFPAVVVVVAVVATASQVWDRKCELLVLDWWCMRRGPE